MNGKTAILVSACLLGFRCRYDGSAAPAESVAALADRFELIPVCPEVLAGLPTPRLPAERLGSRVVRSDGADISALFALGAEKTLRIASERGVAAAILKSRSPSCGYGKIYDGSFRGVLIDGNGVTAETLIRAGIPIYCETDDFSALNAFAAGRFRSKGV